MKKFLMKIFVGAMICIIALGNMCCFATCEDTTQVVEAIEQVEENELQQPSEISPWGAMGLSTKIYQICYGDYGYIVLEDCGQLTGDLCTGDFCGAEASEDGGIYVYYHTYYEYARYSEEFPEITFIMK